MDTVLNLLDFPDSVYLAGAIAAWLTYCGVRGKHMQLNHLKKEEP